MNQPHPYLHEFGVLAGLHFLAVTAPGPDFAMVVRQSLKFDRGSGVRTSLGISLGIVFHSAYCLLGVGWLLASSDVALTTVKSLGAAYLAWIGIHTFRSTPPAGADDPPIEIRRPQAEARAAVLGGFLTNVLNPKAVLFFLALFSVVVNPRTPLVLRAAYCAWMGFATFLWFCCVSIFFSQTGVRRAFVSFGPWMMRILGSAFLVLAARLAYSITRS